MILVKEILAKLQRWKSGRLEMQIWSSSLVVHKPRVLACYLGVVLEHVVDEIRRAFDDAVGVVAVAHEDGAVLTGGGSVLAAISRDLRSYAEGIGGREQMAIEAFAGALEVIPRTLAENAGLDPVNTIIDLRKAHSEGLSSHGVNVYDGGVVDMAVSKVYEPSRVVEQAVQSASRPQS